jgi:magnesium transporter
MRLRNSPMLSITVARRDASSCDVARMGARPGGASSGAATGPTFQQKAQDGRIARATMRGHVAAEQTEAHPATIDGGAGAPQQGVVACAFYQDGRRRDISVEEFGAAARGGGGVAWLGLHEPDERLPRLLQSELGLHELLVEDVHQAHQRPKLDVYGDVTFIAVRTAQLVGGKIEFGETHVIAGKGYVVSIRHGASASYAPVRQRCERAPELLRFGEGFILYSILDFIVDHNFPVIDAIEDELELIEEQIFAVMPANEKIERIYRLRVELQRLRQVVSPLVEICNRLIRHDFPAATAPIDPYLRDLLDHVQLVSESMLDLRERLASAFEASLLLAAERYGQEACELGGDPGGSNGDRRHIRDELQVHAGARLALRLSGRDGGDGGTLRLSLFPLQACRVALA